MNALRIIKEVKDQTLKELEKFNGQTVEIIIFPIDNITSQVNAKETAFEIIEKYSCKVKPWNREEFYE